MGDVLNRRCDPEKIFEFWIDDFRSKKRQIRRKGKENLRVRAILNHAISKSRAELWQMRAKEFDVVGYHRKGDSGKVMVESNIQLS
jgi:hypothetical protein